VKKLALLILALAMVLASITACTTNESPVITGLTAHPSTLAPGGTTGMTCVASDPDGDSITYAWSADDGTVSGVGSEVNWVAPSEAGTYAITVTVSDGKDGSASETCNVVVTAATPTPSPAPTPTPTPMPTPTPTPQVKEIIDDVGRTVVIEGIPERIVSLAPSNTEILFAIDLGDKVVGVTDHCDYPEEALDVPTVGGYFSTNLEEIIGRDPDIVFTDGHDPVCSLLQEVGVTMVVLQPSNIAGIFADIELVGGIAGKEAEAEELIDDMKAHMVSICAMTAAATGEPTIFYEVDATNPALPWTAGSGTFIDTLITLAAGENIATTSGIQGWDTISIEEIIARDPDMIILGDYPWVSPEDVMAREGWDALSAVQSGAIYGLDVDLVSRPGPRIFDGLEEVARIVHPEVFP